MGYAAINPVGYYVHHHGTGHMRRAINVVHHISGPVVMFSSLEQLVDIPDNVTYVQLPSDIVEDYEPRSKATFHYTPYSDKIFDRNRLLIDSWQSLNVRHIYVDVSIEVAVLAKLYGLRVGHAVMSGWRNDPAFTYGYDSCDYLLAHMTEIFDEPDMRRTKTPVHYSGGISRYHKQLPAAISDINNVAIMVSPKAERSMIREVLALAKDNPKVDWHCIGADVDSQLPNIHSEGLLDDPFEILNNADVVIGSGGNNTIMEVASLGKPFICVPEARPYNEQLVAARKLQQLNAAIYMQQFPSPIAWKTILLKIKKLDLNTFSSLVSDDAAERAARIIETVGQPE